MRLLFAGTPAVAVPALEALLASRHTVVAVLTRPDARAGRGRTLAASPVKERALAAGLEVLTPRSPRDEDFRDRHAVIAGDEVTGASTFRIEAGLDTGPVFGTLTETIRPRDTAGDLLDRLAHAGAGLLVATLDAIEDGVAQPVPQPADGVSLAPRLEVEDARVRWEHP